MNTLEYIDGLFKIALEYYQHKDEVSVADSQSILLSISDKIRKQLDRLAKNGTTFHEKALGVLDEEPIKSPHCGCDKIYNMEEIINKIPKLWDNNDRFCIKYCDCCQEIGYVSVKDAKS